jgi:HK97 family phage prohead protease
MEKFETKNFNFEVKATNDNTMEFEGYGSIFGNMDSYRDIVEKGCFNRTIKNNKKRIKILWQHWKPIGKPIDLFEDEKGLYVKGKLSDIQQGKEAYTLMKDKVINEMSIGYSTVISEYDKEKNIRKLKEVKLYEISLVTWGANDKARVNNVKSFDYLLEEMKEGNLLQDCSQEKILNAIDYLKSLITVKDPVNTTLSDNNSIKDDNINSETFDLLLEQLKQIQN